MNKNCKVCSAKNRTIPKFFLNSPLYVHFRKFAPAVSHKRENMMLGGVHLFEFLVIMLVVALTAATFAVLVPSGKSTATTDTSTTTTTTSSTPNTYGGVGR